MNKNNGLPGPTNPGGSGIDAEARAAISELVALKRLDYPSVVILGTSITGMSTSGSTGFGTGTYYRAYGYFTWAQVRANGHFFLLKNAGVAGEKTDQILARVASVIALNPDLCIVEGGANDVPAGYTSAQTIANLTSIYTALRSAGIRVVVTTVTPRVKSVDTAEHLATLNTINRFVRDYALDNKDVILCDWYQCLADADGKSTTTFTNDGTHPNVAGAWRMGKKLYDAINAVYQFSDNHQLCVAADDTNSLLPNCALEGGDTKATGWDVNTWAGVTASKDVYDDGTIKYNRQIVTRAEAGTAYMMYSGAVSVAQGDLVDFAVRLNFDDVTAITAIKVKFSHDSVLICETMEVDLTNVAQAINGVYRSVANYITSATGNCTAYVQFDGLVGSVKISNPTLRKIN